MHFQYYTNADFFIFILLFQSLWREFIKKMVLSILIMSVYQSLLFIPGTELADMFTINGELFDNTQTAFALKSDSQLERAYFLFKMIANEPLVRIGTAVTNFAIKAKG